MSKTVNNTDEDIIEAVKDASILDKVEPKTYRKLQKEIFELKLSLERMEEISNKVF